MIMIKDRNFHLSIIELILRHIKEYNTCIDFDENYQVDYIYIDDNQMYVVVDKQDANCFELVEMSDDFIYGLYLTMLEDENALRYCGEWVKKMCKELLAEYYK